MVDVGYEKILPSSTKNIGGVDTHTGPRLSTFAEAHSRLQADFIPLPTAIWSWPSIDEKEILHGIVGYEQIRTAVIINIGCHDSQTFSHRLGDVRTLTDFSESTVAIIV